MTSRTITSGQKSFNRTNPKDLHDRAVFTFDTDPSRPGLTQITLPAKSTWTPGPHWHEKHVEYFRVVKGRVVIRLGSISKVITPEDGHQRVEKFVVHEFMRADKDLSDDAKDSDEVITEEWTDPADGIKHVFFRNLFSVLQDSESYWKSWTMLQALLVAANYDDYVQVASGRVSYGVTHVLYASIRAIGPLLGLKPWYEEYTPKELIPVATGIKNSKNV